MTERNQIMDKTCTKNRAALVSAMLCKYRQLSGLKYGPIRTGTAMPKHPPQHPLTVRNFPSDGHGPNPYG